MQEPNQNPRKAFEEAVANMAMTTSTFHKDYVFYLHLLAQCRVEFSESLPAAAGVGFDKDRYVLYLNPTPVLGMTQTKEPVQGFCLDMPLKHRIGILKHEMLHIVLGHLIRVEEKGLDFFKYNIASDCALNQEIHRYHLPSYAIYPDNNFPVKSKQRVLSKQTAEYYYELIDEEIINKSQQNSSSGDESGIGRKDPFSSIDDHSTWKQANTANPELQQELTKNMVERAGKETMKARGNLPSGYSMIIDNLTVNRQVDWKKQLRAIVGHKKANKKKTLKRLNRRTPNYEWIKGTIKNRVFDLGVISDVSGSVNDKALRQLWEVIIDICHTFDTSVTVVQVDTTPREPEKLTKTTKLIERKACGGTYLSPAIQAFKERKIPFNALVVTTDGELQENDIMEFAKCKVPVIWLITPNGVIRPSMSIGQMKAIKLTT
jgi:predicted metal-dependent peptidase